ncbi:DUF159 family protein [Elizabethkingia anophelis]|uniref:SOS response-associated peptidase n=1 Tax=Elizabethkingia anophelis TaxID=1117645 RepID=UPI00293CA06F|nr:DUF159 family protein [Elizabethkingia anophelis]MDV3901160.1 DUF159 family protein [Elizabethkingia anophelis]MDV3904909.1 DUF159 family protein [Elizabethkingia anophelis]MDV4058462.1 DUF159 family protein [Elizabethkingia anophelis]
MCFYISMKLNKKELEDNFNAKVVDGEYIEEGFVSGFAHPNVPIITDNNQSEIVLGNWGIIPFWAKNRDIQKNTLNARIETISDKPSFKNSVHKRCLVLVNGFYEWKWLDPKGKQKEKYFIHLDNDNKPFALGGIYSLWTDKESGEQLKTFSIVTTEANELMAEIHNTKHRMPVVLNKGNEKEWLNDRDIQSFSFQNYNPNLKAVLA